MGRHLRLFGMDFPPLIALLAEAARLFGDSLLALRFTPALAHAALVLLAGLLAREFGGGRFAQLLAALPVALTPLFLRAGNLFQPVVFDQLWWTLTLLLLARLGRHGFPAASRGWLPFRAVGWACLVSFVVIMLLRGKPYYAGPLFPTLFAAGAVVLQRLSDGWRERGHAAAPRVLRGGAVGLVLVFGALILPLGLPLPQDYADMLGWPAQAAAVARAYHSLSPAERRETVLIGTNYGRAGALDFFGPRHGLPPAVAPVGSYWFFGPGEKPGRVLLVLGGTRAELQPYCRHLTQAGRVAERWAVPEEQAVSIWLCRRPYHTLQALWPRWEGQN